jgi:hypothetical protein
MALEPLNHPPVPEFATREEEAAFWDTHSLGEYWDSATSVDVRFARSLSRGLTIRLDPATLAALRAEAHAQGMGPTTLARSWIMERLAEGAKHKA